MKKLAFLAVVLNLLCADAPQWFTNPQPNPEGFYGIGSGENIRGAKRSAIADLGSAIYLNVQSSFHSQTKRVDDNFSSSATQNINLSTQDLKLGNLEIAKSECEDGECYVRVEISREDLVALLRGEITLGLDEFRALSSPFDYAYKKNVLFPRLVRDFSLFSSLGGVG